MNTLDEVRHRALLSIRADYRAWLRYGDAEARQQASTMAWVLSGWLGPAPHFLSRCPTCRPGLR